MQPRGAQIGAATKLTLTGAQLGPSPLLLVTEHVSATPLSPALEEGSAQDGSLVYLVEVGHDAAPGLYPLRVETSEGISNALLLTLGEFPQVAELESQTGPEDEPVSNDSVETAQAVPVPGTVEGRLDGPDRDTFTFAASKGQELVIEVAARRVGSAIDPAIELLDADGRVIARNSDSPGLGLDSRLAFHVPADGNYSVAVRDERFSNQKQNFYRLTVGEYRFADRVFPLGWQRGSAVQAEFGGGNLTEPLHGEVDLAGLSGNATETWVRVPGTASSVRFLLGDAEEAMENGSGGELAGGVVMNGRISAQGETDRYRLAVADGEQWSFELHSGELPGSSLYGVMTLSSGDEVLAVAGKYAGDPNPYVITSTGETATFPFINLTVPPGTSEITVTVEDLLGRGGPGHAYRLIARKQGPDFLLTVREPQVNIPRGGSAMVDVTAERRGYYGPIQLYLEDPPDGLEIGGGHIPTTSTLGNTLPRFEVGSLTLSARMDADLGALDLVVRGRAVEKGSEHLDRRAVGPGIRVAVNGANQPNVTAEGLGFDLPARINPAQPAYVEFVTGLDERLVRGGKGVIVEWAYKPRRPGLTLKKPVAIPRNGGGGRIRFRKLDDDKESKESGGFRMFTHERTSLGTVDFTVSATVTADGRDHVLYSKPLVVSIVDGYGLDAPETPLELAVGGEGTWQGKIWRETEFQRTVSVSAIGLPVGVQCKESVLQDSELAYQLHCAASDKAAPGDYDVEIRAESVLSDEGTTPYPADPVKTKLTISR